MIKNKYNLRNIALAIIFLSAVTACKDGLDKLQVEPPIIALLSGEDIIKKNVKDTIPLFINLKIAASEKLASFELTKDGEVMDFVTFTSEFSSIYQYQYTIEDGLEIGDEVLFGLKVTDQAGQETIRNITLEILNRLFFLDIVELNGQVLRSIEGTIDTVFTMSADTSWIVEGELKVQPGAVLNIEAGTTIYMRTSSNLAES
ncbi:MAG: hypothetical protein L3J29_12990 [Cyclobacteriaceae bacterium]|nr:hypothetical protein [Cyclobacteriaceae bacterium]